MENWNLFESGALVWIQENLRTELLDKIMPYVSALNNAGILAIITVLALLAFKKYREVGITACSSLLVEYIIVNLIIKPLVNRTRPYVVNELLIQLGKRPTDASFPSGHTGAAFAVALVMLFTMPKKYGITAVVIATLIAYSRLYNGCHFPTDVLGGFLIALLTSILATKLVYPRAKKFIEDKRAAKAAQE